MENYLSIRLMHNYKPIQQLTDNIHDFHLARRKYNIEQLLQIKRESKSSVNIYKNNTTNNNNNINMIDSNQNKILKLNINDLQLPSKFEIDVYNYYSSVNVF